MTIEPQPEDFPLLEESYTLEVNPERRISVHVENGTVYLFHGDSAVVMTEWEFCEIGFLHSKKRIEQLVRNHKNRSKR